MLAVTLAVLQNKATNGQLMAPTFFLLGVSFSLIAAIAVDRLLAVSLHLRYQELVTEERFNFGLTALWFSNVLFTLAFMNLPSHNDLVTVTCLTVGLILLTIAYFRIYLVVRYHQNQIHGQNQIQMVKQCKLPE